ncbi:MAG: M20/M25/M40 family metallo-hydrolase [Verrucomicrobiota bacterium]|nr:M20/M25/M40 family metallo-hydrolase [Verrucomicrobiota bacterium]
MRKTILKIAEAVLNLPTAPFREHAVRDFIRDFCRARGIAVRQDEMGNLLVTYGGGFRGNPVLAFAAHMDHPGFIITKNSRRGVASALVYGAVEKEYFVGARVRVFTTAGEVTGRVISTRFNTRRMRERVKLEVRGNVRKGDPAMWDLAPFRIKGSRLYSRACDDLVGCVSILAMLDALRRRRERKKVIGIFTVAEEGGLHGAIGLCVKRRLPKKAHLIAIETSRELPAAGIGDGVVIRVGDMLSIFRPEMTAFMVHAARRLAAEDPAFRFQRKLMDGGICESTIYDAFGYMNGAVCVPLGNYHNRNFERKRIEAEYVSTDDLENMVKLFLAMVERVRDLPSFLNPPVPKYREERRRLGERCFWKRR